MNNSTVETVALIMIYAIALYLAGYLGTILGLLPKMNKEARKHRVYWAGHASIILILCGGVNSLLGNTIVSGWEIQPGEFELAIATITMMWLWDLLWDCRGQRR